MKIFIFLLFITSVSIVCNAQTPGDPGALLKYPDELVFDKSLMDYTIYKPNIKIACKFPVRMVSKTMQRTVFMSEEDTMKLSFAFFALDKLPFYNSSDNLFESSYKFYAWDSSARAKANMPPLSILKYDEQKELLYYRGISGNKTNVYLVGTKDNIVSLILISSKDLQLNNIAGDVSMSYKLNLQD